MVWPDGVTFNSDGFMYSGAAQLDADERAAGRRRGEEQGALSGLPVPARGGGQPGLLK